MTSAFHSYSTAQIELDERLAVRICQGDGMTLEERQRAQYLIREAIRMRCDGPNVPEGWKLVPIKPTDAMIEAQFKCWHDENGGKEAYVAQMYTAMVEACPPFATGRSQE